MSTLGRRDFIRSASLAAAVSATGLSAAAEKPGQGSAEPGRDASADMQLGIIIEADDPEKGLERVKKLGFSTCELGLKNFSVEHAQRVKKALAAAGVSPTAVISNGPGETRWNFYEGPRTIGLVPRTHRAERMARLKQAVDFCVEAGIPAINSHFGFIPEDPNDPLYGEFISAVHEVASYAKGHGILVRFETGQETPVTLLRAITDIGTDNLGVNYDTANLILYGKANPVDGLEVLGPHVQSLHAKDGTYPTGPRDLGEETPIGQGWVDFPAVIRKLKKLGFKGHITIEREIEGEEQTRDILASKDYLQNLIRTA
ncbi:sugar phosphate isomerase/epimerase [bacterium]|nr:sugar phosphate isomerase/epimerase [bacterium]